MDEIDEKLLHLLQMNARASLKTLAQEVRMSSPAVSARLERLERDGVILGYTAEINVQKLGYHILAYIHLDLAPERKPEFINYVSACRNVIECSCVTGAYSMLLKVGCPSTQELDAFIDALQKYGKTKTQIVYSVPIPSRGLPGC